MRRMTGISEMPTRDGEDKGAWQRPDLFQTLQKRTVMFAVFSSI